MNVSWYEKCEIYYRFHLNRCFRFPFFLAQFPKNEFNFLFIISPLDLPRDTFEFSFFVFSTVSQSQLNNFRADIKWWIYFWWQEIWKLWNWFSSSLLPVFRSFNDNLWKNRKFVEKILSNQKKKKIKNMNWYSIIIFQLSSPNHQCW